jgi:hypothetical protein
MSENIIVRDRFWNRAREVGHVPLFEELESYLTERGHRGGTLRIYLEAALHFIGWLTEQHSTSQAIDAEMGRDFLENHLPECRCSYPAPRHLKTVRAALNQLLLMVGKDRLRAAPPRVSAEIEVSISQFDAFMRDVGGLAQSTRWNRCRYIREFLAALFGSKPLTFDRLGPEVVVQYVTDQASIIPPVCN